MKRIDVAQGVCDASEIVLRHDCLTHEVRALLAYGAVPDRQSATGGQSATGATPLHMISDRGIIAHCVSEDAEGAGPLKIAEYLLLAGADPNILSEPHFFGRTPLGTLFSALRMNAERAISTIPTYTGPYSNSLRRSIISECSPGWRGALC